MRLDERWLWLGDTRSARDSGVVVYRAHVDSWWIVTGDQMIGPFVDRSILRAVRVACTPTIDGCERGPTKLGVTELAARHPLCRGPRWREIGEDELPPSVTVYDQRAVEPVSGCCMTFDAMPQVDWGSGESWDAYLEARPACGGLLAASWNAHPRGSHVFSRSTVLEPGFTIVDVPRFAAGAHAQAVNAGLPRGYVHPALERSVRHGITRLIVAADPSRPASLEVDIVDPLGG